MYIKNGFTVKRDWWRYVLTMVITLGGIFLFSLPHSAALAPVIHSEDVDSSKLGDVNYLMTLLDSNLSLLFMLLPFLGGLLFLIFSVNNLHHQSLVTLTTARKKIDWKRVFFSFSVWGFFVVAAVFLQLITNPETLEFNFQLKPFLILTFIGILLIPIQTSFEEYVFRGYLMQSLAVLTKRKLFPLIFTSVIFGVLHIQNPEVAKLGYGLLVYYITTGLFLGVLTLMDDGMELSLGFHAANNLIAALLVTADWQVFQTYSLFKDNAEPNLITAVLPSFVLFPVMLFLFAKKYKWHSWKEKLTGMIDEA